MAETAEIFRFQVKITSDRMPNLKWKFIKTKKGDLNEEENY
jgi:hypothetical protein